jgi:hypothetical protein
MANPNPDLCNPLAIWEAFIALLLGTSATASPPSSSSLPTSLCPPFLREPDFEIREHSGRFQVGKPNYGIFDATVLPSAPFTVIGEFATRPEADKFIHGIPKVRLPAQLLTEVHPNGSVSSLPASRQFNWTTDPDARNIADRLTDFLNHIPLGATLPGPPNVVLNLAILPDPAQTRPDPANPNRAIVLIDPFQISQGVLELCATYVHELTHAQFYQRRGFPPAELTSLLSRDDYLLVNLDEEFSCFKNEVTAVQQFLAVVPAHHRQAFTDWVDTAISAPAKLYFASGLAAMSPATVENLIHKFVGDEYLLRYQDEYRSVRGSLVPSAAASAWISSPEWTAIQATRPLWQNSGVL